MATILYSRVSTADQSPELQLAQAEAAGFVIDETVVDHGVSGITTRLADRPEGRRLFDKLRKGDVLVVRWLDRLGRNYTDVTDVIRDLMRRGVVIRTVTNQFNFDGSTRDPMQRAVRDALIGFMAALGEAQATATKEAQRAGIAAARLKGNRYLGRRPTFTRDQLDAVVSLAKAGKGASEIARSTGLSRPTVIRIRADAAAASAALARWEPPAPPAPKRKRVAAG